MGWQLIESQSLQASAASVTFSSIPQTYKSLKLMVSGRSDRGDVNADLALSVNGSSANLTYRSIYGTGATVGSSTGVSAQGAVAGNSATALTFGSAEYTFPSYSGSTNKPISVDTVGENNATTSGQQLAALLNSSTTAISSLTVATNSTTNWVFGSTFTLYGLL